MLRFGETKYLKKSFMLKKKLLKLVSKLYCIGYLDKAERPLVLIMPKMSGYI